MKTIKIKLNLFLVLISAISMSLISCSSSGGSDDPTVVLPKLESASPANGATDVAYDNATLTLTFNKGIRYTASGISIDNSATIAEMTNVASTKVLVISLASLKASTQYTVTVAAGAIKDTDGNQVAPFTISFTTMASQHTIVPEVNPDKTGMSHDSKPLAKNLYVGWNLGNSLESQADGVSEDDQETSWGNPITTEAMVQAVKAAGFNTIRIPIRWYNHSDVTATSIQVHSKWMARVKQVVDYCINNGLYVIINTHHELWIENHALYADAANIEIKEKSLWKQIATAFRDYDEHLIFSGTNEVHIEDNWGAPTAENLAVQNNFNQWFVDAVRTTGGKNYYRNLIVQTYAASPDNSAGFIMPEDVVENRMMVEFHFYQPYDYSLAGTSYYWGEPYKGYGVLNWGQESYIDDTFNAAKSRWVDNGYAVILGEYGVCNHFKGTAAEQAVQSENRQYYLTYVVSSAKSHGLVPIVWDNNAFNNGTENFGIFDRNDNMNIRHPEMLNGIMAGAKTDYPY